MVGLWKKSDCDKDGLSAKETHFRMGPACAQYIEYVKNKQHEQDQQAMGEHDRTTFHFIGGSHYLKVS